MELSFLCVTLCVCDSVHAIYQGRSHSDTLWNSEQFVSWIVPEILAADFRPQQGKQLGDKTSRFPLPFAKYEAIQRPRKTDSTFLNPHIS